MKATVKNFLIISLITISSISFTSCSKDGATEDIYLNEDQTSAVNNATGNTTTYTYTSIENETINIVNTYRASIGLNSLTKISSISEQAATHTNYIIKKGKISHDNFNQRSNFLKNNIRAKSVGENVASGFSTAKSVLNGWLNSPTHRAIIEDPKYTHTGIAIKTDENGKKYFVQMFVVKK